MKRNFLLFLLFLVFFPTNVFASTPEEQRKAVLETANAYYTQKAQLQYDSYRKNLYSTPEDATSKHTSYTVCSGFVFMTYYQSLGIKIPDSTEALLDYAEANKGSENVIFYYGSAKEIYTEDVLGVGRDTVTNNEKKAFINKIIDNVKPGDIYVYYGESGHAMLVKSVDKVNKKITLIEGNGDRYDFTNHIDKLETKGAIVDNIDFADKLYANRTRMALIRVITDGNTFKDASGATINYDITPAAKTRLKYSNIDIGKIISNVDNQYYAQLGDELTYQLRIRNRGNSSYENISITETFDPNITLVNSGEGIVSGNTITWNIASISPGTYVTLYYTVKIPNNSALIGKIILSTGKVENIATSKIETLIGKGLSSAEQKQVANAFNKLKSTSSATTSREFINEVYKESLNIDLGISNLKNLDAINYDSNNKSSGQNTLSIKYTGIKDSAKKYLYSNFYGLRIAENQDETNNLVKASLAWNTYPNYELNDRPRTLTKELLKNGDILLAYVGRSSTTDTEMGNKGYLYLNNTLYRFKSANSFEEIKGDNLTTFLNNLIGENYIILRPYVKKMVSIQVTTPPTKKEYFKNSNSIDLTGGILTITYDDKTTEKISLVNSKIKITGFDSSTIGTKTITVEYNGLKANFNINVSEKSITKISINKLPNKTQYYLKMETLDLTGGSLKVEYNNGSFDTVSLKSNSIQTSGFNNSKLGKNEITVTYKDKKTNFSVEIIESKSGIVLSTKPLKNTFQVKEEQLDLTGGIITYIKEDGTKENISLDNENVKITGFDNSKVGITNITVEYQEEKLQIPIEVIDKDVLEIKVETLPVKVNYLKGKEELDLTGGVVLVKYDDNTTDHISLNNENISINGYDNKIVGTNNISVKYRNISTQFNVNIVDKNITGIEIDTLPTKTVYIINEEKLDLTGGIIKIKYDDNTTDLISMTNKNINVAKFDNTKAGLHKIEIEYLGNKTMLEINIINNYETNSSNSNVIIFIIISIIILIESVILIVQKTKKNKNTNTI